jgi:predicted  nucleic acid-binding Zn-ribbon protein
MTTNETNHTRYDTSVQETQSTTDGYLNLTGVTAEKSVTVTATDTLLITFDVNSTRTEPINVEIRDALPENFPLDRIGFHPDYGREHWSIDDGHEAVYESTLEPQSNLRTLYAIKPDGQGDPSIISTETEMTASIDGEPARGGVDHQSPPATDGTDLSEQIRDQREVSEGDSDEVDTFELADPNEETQVPPQAEAPVAEDTMDEKQTTAETDSDTTTDDSGPNDDHSRDSQSEESGGRDGSLISQLTSELADAGDSDEDLEALGEQLSSLVENESRGRNSFDARLQRTERELNELSAYTDALSEFLDERGSGQAILDDLEDQTAAVQSRLETTVDRVEELDERLEAAETRDERFAERFDAVDDRHEETTDRIDGVTDRLDTVDHQIDTLEGDLSTLRDAHDEAGDRVDRIEESVERIDERLDAAEEERDAHRESLSTEIESVAEEFEEMRNWHRDFERLLEEFGTVGSEATNREEDASREETAPDTATDGPSAAASEPEDDDAERNSN